MANFTRMTSVDYHHGNLKEALIQAGESELLRVGSPLDLSLREIARVAGVSHNAPYRHFKSKDDLVTEIIERSINELAEQILSAPLLYPASLLLQMQYVGRLWALIALRQPHKAKLMFYKYTSHHELLKLNLSSILQNSLGIELQHDVNTETLAVILMASFNGIAMMYAGQFSSVKTQIKHFRTDDDLYTLTDEAAHFILRSTLL